MCGTCALGRCSLLGCVCTATPGWCAACSSASPSALPLPSPAVSVSPLSCVFVVLALICLRRTCPPPPLSERGSESCDSSDSAPVEVSVTCLLRDCAGRPPLLLGVRVTWRRRLGRPARRREAAGKAAWRTTRQRSRRASKGTLSLLTIGSRATTSSTTSSLGSALPSTA